MSSLTPGNDTLSPSNSSLSALFLQNIHDLLKYHVFVYMFILFLYRNVGLM